MFLPSSSGQQPQSYQNFLDLVNKRTGFVTFMATQYHTKYEHGTVLSLTAVVDKILQEFEALQDKAEPVAELAREFKQLMYNAVRTLDTHPAMPRVRIHGDLALDKIHIDEIENLYIEDTPQVYIYDYMYDYACIRVKTSLHSRYTSMLANENLITAIKAKYKDRDAGTRYIMYAVIVDFISFMQLYIKASKGESLEGIQIEDPNVVYERLISFLIKSYTTIDYFNYVYK